ncbi:MAG: Ig-like domain-containing protein, partial [Rhodocyclaceae bacterium]|nr:Ig-like domain-containing protein [Rhodocyclaceae bacterium]
MDQKVISPSNKASENDSSLKKGLARVQPDLPAMTNGNVLQVGAPKAEGKTAKAQVWGNLEDGAISQELAILQEDGDSSSAEHVIQAQAGSPMLLAAASGTMTDAKPTDGASPAPGAETGSAAGTGAMAAAGSMSPALLALAALGVAAAAGGGGGGGSSTPAAPADTTPPAAPVIGTVATDNVVNAAEKAAGVTVSGTAEANSTVAITWGGTTHTVTASGAGSWTTNFTSGEIPADASTTLSATARDAAGNTSTAGTRNVTVDTTVATPTLALAADTGVSNTDGITTNGQVNVSGLEAGGTWQYSTNGGGSWTTGSGSSFNLAANTSFGAGQIEVRQTDAAGNASGTGSIAGTVTTDTVVPVITGMAAHSTTSVVGTPNTVVLTYDSPLGATVTAPAASDFNVVVGANPATHPTGVTVNNDNTITLSFAPGTIVLGSVSVTYIPGADANPVQDVAGNRGAAFFQGTAADGYVRGASISVVDSLGVTHATGITTDANGDFFLPTNASGQFVLGDGSAVTIQSITASGGVNVDTGVPNTVVLKAPAGSSAITPLTTLVQAVIDAAPVGSKPSASDASATVVGSLGLAAGTDLTSYDPLAVLQANPNDTTALAVQKATAQVDALVSLVASDSGGSAAATHAIANLATQVSGGAVNLTSSSTIGTILTDASTGTSLASGDTQSTIAAANSAIGTSNNLSAVTAAQSKYLDTIAPLTPTVQGLTNDPVSHLTTDTGSSHTDGITSVAAPTVRLAFNATATDGTAAVAGDKLVLMDNGVALVGITAGSDTVVGGSITLSATDITNGYVNVTTPTLAEGTHNLTASLTDQAGNSNGASGALAVTIDATAPAAPLATLHADTGVSNTDHITSNGLVDVAGLETGATWQYSTDGGTSWSTGTGNSFTLAAGSYANVKVRQTDLAGNSDAFSIIQLGTINVDQAAPAAPGFALAVDTGASLSDWITSNGQVNVSGLEVAAGTSWQYSTDGGTHWTTGSGSSFTLAASAYTAGQVQVRQTDVAGNTGSAALLPALTVDQTNPGAPALTLHADTGLSASDGITSNGQVDVTGLEAGATWQYSTDGSTWNTGSGTSFTLAQGTYGAGTVQVKQTDVAGNTGAAYASSSSIIVDTTLPTAGTSLTSTVTSGTTTNVQAPTLSGTVSGTLGAGEVVAIFDGATQIGTAAAGAGGAWTFNTPALSNAGHSFTARIEDAAGNLGTASSAYAFTVNAAVPSATAAITRAVDGVGSITGNVASGGVTDDPGIALSGTVTGTLAAGDQVMIYDGTTLLGAATVATGAGGTTWSYPPTLTTDGAHNFKAVVQASGGNQGTASTVYSLTLDTVAPPLTPFTLAAGSDSGASNTDGISNVARPTIQFTAEAGSALSIDLGNGAGYVAAGTGTGAMQSLTAPAGAYAADGTYTIHLKATDAAGNATIQTATYQLDTHAPTLSAITLAAGSDSGIVGDGISNVTTPTIQFTAEAGSTLAIDLGNGVFQNVPGPGGVGVLIGTGGVQTLTAPTAIAADGSYTIRLRATDVAGNSTVQTAAYTLDTHAPGAPVGLVLASASDSGVKGDGITNVTTPTITGTAEAGATVTLYDGASVLGTATANATTGAWSIASSALASGSHAITARATDVAGNPSGASSALTVNIDTAAPTIGVTAVGDANKTAAEAKATGGVVSVTDGASGDTVTVVLTGAAGGAAHTLTKTYVSDGTAHAVTLTSSDLTALGQGLVTLSTTATDAAGNTSAANTTGGFTLDTIAPNAPHFALHQDTGTSGTDSITQNAQLDVTGIEANATWQYSTDSGAHWTTGTGSSINLAANATYAAGAIIVQQTDLAGNVSGTFQNTGAIVIDNTVPNAPAITGYTPDTGVVGDGITSNTQPTFSGTAEANATVNLTITKNGAAFTSTTVAANASGAWSYHPATALADGVYAMTATATDAAGNTGTASNTATVTIDHTAPAAPAITGYTPDTGVVGDGITSNTQPTFSGTAENNATVNLAITRNGAAFATTTVVANGSGAWSYQPGTALADGVYAMTATATDAAGNTGTASNTATVTIDHTPPTAPVITGISPDTGTSATDAVTRISTGTLSGTAEAGSAIKVYVNGSVTPTYTATTDGTGHWNIAYTSLPDNTYTVVATATDAAGNVSGNSAPATMVIDTAAPTVAITAIAGDNFINATEHAAPGGVTVTGSTAGVADGQIVTVHLNGHAYTATVASNAWTATVNATDVGALADKTSYTATADVSDLAGNPAPQGSQSVYVSTTGPGVMITAITGDNMINAAEHGGPITISGTTAGANGQPVTVTLNGVTYDNTTTAAPVVVSGNSWTLTVPQNAVTALGDGPYTVTASVADVAGTPGSQNQTLTVDTIAPSETFGSTIGTNTGAATTIASGGLTKDNTLALSGTVSDANGVASVHVFDGATDLGAATVSGGNWSFTTAALSDAGHSFT